MNALLSSASLFAASPADPMGEALGWISGTLLGTIATSASVIAIAFVGFQMLSGRLPIRRGLQVVVGCFLLLGAPLVAASLSGAWQQSAAPPAPPPVPEQPDDPRGDLPPSDYDPYAGASLRRD